MFADVEVLGFKQMLNIDIMEQCSYKWESRNAYVYSVHTMGSPIFDSPFDYIFLQAPEALLSGVFHFRIPSKQHHHKKTQKWKKGRGRIQLSWGNERKRVRELYKRCVKREKGQELWETAADRAHTAYI